MLSYVEFATDFENDAHQRFWTYIESVAIGNSLPAKKYNGTGTNDDRWGELLRGDISAFLCQLPDDKEADAENVGTKKKKTYKPDLYRCDWVNLFNTNSIEECRGKELKQYLRSIRA
jgi:hypothetical protein